MEVQRHFVILSSFLVLVWLVQGIPLKKTAVAAIVTALMVSLPFHWHFIRAFTEGPNLVKAEIPYLDYFSMNRWIESHTRGMPVLASQTFPNGGFPIVQESTTSFSVTFDAFIYDSIPRRQLADLHRTEAQHLVLPWGRSLGYRTALWGPIEDRMWGLNAKNRFIRERALIHREGAVGLYALDDYFWQNAPPSYLTSLSWRGDRLAEQGWLQEAFDHYAKSLLLHPNDSYTSVRLEQLLLRTGD
jgi:hypothetical protein